MGGVAAGIADQVVPSHSAIESVPPVDWSATARCRARSYARLDPPPPGGIAARCHRAPSHSSQLDWNCENATKRLRWLSKYALATESQPMVGLLANQVTPSHCSVSTSALPVS